MLNGHKNFRSEFALSAQYARQQSAIATEFRDLHWYPAGGVSCQNAETGTGGSATASRGSRPFFIERLKRS
jgi:hypothetical protein